MKEADRLHDVALLESVCEARGQRHQHRLRGKRAVSG
jgi:hypothetical protein